MDGSDRDAVLLGLLANGDNDAFPQLFERHQAPLGQLIRKAGASSEEAEELLQETWIRVRKNADTFDASLPFLAWAFTIALNRLRSLRRRDQTDAKRRAGMEEAIAASSPPLRPDEVMQQRELAEAIRRDIATLPAIYERALMLRYYEGMSEPQIADALDLPLGTVKSHLRRGVLKLQLLRRGKPYAY